MFISDVSKLSEDSNVYVIVKCDEKNCPECEKKLEQKYSSILNNIQKNKGKFICDKCLLNKNDLLDCNYFNTIDNIEKAYLFGLLFNNIRSINCPENKKECYLDIRIPDLKKSNNIINLLRYIGHNIIYNNSMKELTMLIKSEEMISDIYKQLNIIKLINTHDIDFTYFIENLKSLDLQIAFIRAYIEYNNVSSIENDKIKFVITSYSERTLIKIKEIINIPCDIKKNFNITYLFYYDVNVIDMLGVIFKNSNELKQSKLYELYIKYLNDTIDLPLCKILKTDENAVLPSKTRESDVGYDLTIIKEVKRFNKTTVLYDTGIKLYIQPGYYVEVVPRSSISKSGYILSNSIGIIDQSYRGNIMVSLTKIDNESSDLILPFKCCQIIIRKQYYGNIIEVVDSFEETDRNAGGYGSTSS